MKTLAQAIVMTVVSLAACRAEAVLVQYWALEEGSGTTTANDVSGGNTGVLEPADGGGTGPIWTSSGLEPKLTTRKFDPSSFALDFEPADPDFLDVGNVGLSSTGSGGTVSFSAWFRPDALSGDNRLLGQLSGVSANGGAARVIGSGGIEIWDGADWNTVAPGGSMAVGTWSHLALVWDTGAVTAYVNGTMTGSATSDFDFSGDSLGIGSKFLGSFGSGFDGAIDDISLWDSVLTTAQLEFLAAGQAADMLGVPEPSSAILLLVGLAPMTRARGRRRGTKIGSRQRRSL